MVTARSKQELVRLGQVRPGGRGEGRVRLYCLPLRSLRKMRGLRPASRECGVACSGFIWSLLLPLKGGGSEVRRGRDEELAPSWQQDPNHWTPSLTQSTAGS